jgi:hypothetical protein
VIGFAGNFANGDGGGASIVEAKEIPVVAAAQTDVFQRVSTVFDVHPPAATPTTAKHRWLYAQGVRKAALVTLSNDAAVAELNEHQRQIEAAGIKVVSRQVLPVTTLSFDSAARTVANSGAQYLFFLAAGQHDAAMAQSMRDTGYKLQFEEYLTGYGSNYLEIAGDAAEGTTSWTWYLPTEDGGRNPVQKAFVEWMNRVAPGEPTDVFAAESWASAMAFSDALDRRPGPDLARVSRRDPRGHPLVRRRRLLRPDRPRRGTRSQLPHRDAGPRREVGALPAGRRLPLLSPRACRACEARSAGPAVPAQPTSLALREPLAAVDTPLT